MISDKEIDQCFNAIARSKVVVYDVETSGLSWQQNFIVGYVFSVGPSMEETWYLPVRHKYGQNIPGTKIPSESVDDFAPHPIEYRIAKEVASRPDLHVVGHNLKFDLHMSGTHNIWFKGTVEDTMVNAALIDENQKGYSLDKCCEYAGIEGKFDIGEEIKKWLEGRGIKPVSTKDKLMNYLWEMPPEGAAGHYAKQDGVSTYKLWLYQQREIENQELGLVHSVEKRVTNTLFRMERRGVPVDVKRLDKVNDELQKTKKEARSKLPNPNMNVRSRIELYEYFKKLNFTDFVYTEKDMEKDEEKRLPSFTEKWLESIPAGQEIIEIRQMENLSNTFIESSIKGHLFYGRIHATLNQAKMDEHGTVSGRLSSSDPNMQQIPKRNKKLAPLLRQLFRDKELWWRSKDFKSQEYRVFAEYAKSKLVLDAYAKDPDTDYHQLVADILGVERDPAAKRINLGTIYNMGLAKLAFSLGCSVEQAQSYLNTMRDMMPEARNFNKRAQNTAMARGFVRTKLGRRRRFPNGKFAHKAGNAIIQGTSADMTKLKMVEIDEYLLSEGCNSQLILQVHDSLEFLMDPAEEKYMEEITDIMCSFGENDLIQFQVPIRVDDMTGVSWGHATFPKYDNWI